MNFPRYIHKNEPREMFCEDEKLKKLQQYQKGMISEREFLNSVGNAKEHIGQQ